MTIAELQRLNQVHPVNSRPVKQVGQPQEKQPDETTATRSVSFGDVLNKQLADQNLRFSAHALHRMNERNISLSQEDIQRLNSGVERARAKGSNDSLVLMDEMAYIVSVKNQTVITALTKEMSKDNVYTNIDSVAIV
ncbi:MAG: TIGR02530 family flagellar biosynthesis protein [Candidatus Neomarinimicrobiota bacterium]